MWRDDTSCWYLQIAEQVAPRTPCKRNQQLLLLFSLLTILRQHSVSIKAEIHHSNFSSDSSLNRLAFNAARSALSQDCRCNFRLSSCLNDHHHLSLSLNLHVKPNKDWSKTNQPEWTKHLLSDLLFLETHQMVCRWMSEKYMEKQQITVPQNLWQSALMTPVCRSSTCESHWFATYLLPHLPPPWKELKNTRQQSWVNCLHQAPEHRLFHRRPRVTIINAPGYQWELTWFISKSRNNSFHKEKKWVCHCLHCSNTSCYAATSNYSPACSHSSNLPGRCWGSTAVSIHVSCYYFLIQTSWCGVICKDTFAQTCTNKVR